MCVEPEVFLVFLSPEQQAEIVVARKGTYPTKSNSVPLGQSGVGRCSLVLYSPASMYSTVGYEEDTIQAMKEAGHSADISWAETVPAIYPNA